MKYSIVGKDTMLDALGATHVSLHTGIPNQTGSNEVAGGTPAYARQPLTVAPAAAGAVAISNNPVFDVPSGDVIFFLGLWNDVAAGDFLGCAPINGGTVKAAGTADAGTDLVTAYGHGLAADNRVTFDAVSGAALPAGLSATVIYFVLAAGLTADVFAVSLTSGGAAIDITVSSEVVFQKVIPQTFSAQGTLTVSSGAYDLNG